MIYRSFKRLAVSIAMLFPALVLAQPCTCPQQVVRSTGPALPLTDLLKGHKPVSFPRDPITGLDSLLGRLHYADLRRTQSASGDWSGLKIIVTGRSLRIPSAQGGITCNLTPCIDTDPKRRQVINSSLEFFPDGVARSPITPTGPVTTCHQAFLDMMQAAEMDWPGLLMRLGDMQRDFNKFQGFIAQLAKQVKLGKPGKNESVQDYLNRLSLAVKAAGNNLPEQAYAAFLLGLEGKDGSVSQAFMQTANGLFLGTRAKFPQIPADGTQPRFLLKADIGRMAVEFPADLLNSKSADSASGVTYSYLLPVRDLSWTDTDGLTAETGVFSCGPRLQVGSSGLTLQSGQAVVDASAISSPLLQKYCGQLSGPGEDFGTPSDLKTFTGVYWAAGSGWLQMNKNAGIPVQFRHVFADAGSVRGKLYISCNPKGKNSFSINGPDGSKSEFSISKLAKSLKEQGFSEVSVRPVDLLGNGQYSQIRVDFLYIRGK